VIESVGVKRSLEKMKQADLVLYVFDVKEAVSELNNTRSDLVANNVKFLSVANKIDVGSEPAFKEKFGDFDSIIFVSAKMVCILKLKGANGGCCIAGRVQTESTIVKMPAIFMPCTQLHSSLLDVQKGLAENCPVIYWHLTFAAVFIILVRSPERSQMKINWIIFFRSFVSESKLHHIRCGCTRVLNTL
jgi:tRNA modification GTPase